MQVMNRDVWIHRYTERLVEGGLDRATATAAAACAVEHADDWLSPQDAAAEELSYWRPTMTDIAIADTETQEPEPALRRFYSRDDEVFRFNDVGELLDDMAADGCLVPGAVYYEADSAPVTADDIVGSGWLLDSLDDQLYELTGEAADGEFSTVDQAAKDELTKLLVAWIERHVNLSLYWRIVGHSRQCEVTAEDVAMCAS